MELPEELVQMVRQVREQMEGGVPHEERYHDFRKAWVHNPETDEERYADEVNRIFATVNPVEGVCLSPEESFNITAQMKTLAWSILYDATHGNEGDYLTQVVMSDMLKQGVEPIHPKDDREAAQTQTNHYTPITLRRILLYLAEQLRQGVTPTVVRTGALEARQRLSDASIDAIEEAVNDGRVSVRALIDLLRAGNMPDPRDKSSQEEGSTHGQYL